MSLWTFPGTVTAVLGTTFLAELDLGLRHYHPAVIRPAGVRPRPGELAEHLQPGARFVATTGRLTGVDPVRAHVTLADGLDLATAVRGRLGIPVPAAEFGGTLAKTWRYPISPLRVVDGDTVFSRIDIGAPTLYAASVRVEGINAAELPSSEGVAAHQYAWTVLPTAVRLASRKLDKYGRPLGSITLSDGRDFAAAMLAAGHAIPYQP